MSSTPFRTRDRAHEQAESLAIAMIESVPVPLLLLDSGLRVFRSNQAFATNHGKDGAARKNGTGETSPEGVYFPEFAGETWGIPGLRQPLEAISDNRRADFEVEKVLAGPERRTLRLTARMVAAGPERFVMVAVEDVTFTQIAQERLEEDNGKLHHQFDLVSQALIRTRQDLENLTGRLLTAQEEERRRLARELHDDLSQQVAILRMDSERIAKQMPEAPRALGVYLRNLRKQTQKLSRDLRRVAHQLHPSILEHLGLPAALESLAREFGERDGIDVRFAKTGTWDGLPLEIATAVYRIAQEALRNVSKHAGASGVDLELTGSAERVTMTIRDNGKGFDPVDPGGIGLGMISMQERARLAGGRLHIRSERGKGTTIAVDLPTRAVEV